jgi:O-antigen ligase
MRSNATRRGRLIAPTPISPGYATNRWVGGRFFAPLRMTWAPLRMTGWAGAINWPLLALPLALLLGLVIGRYSATYAVAVIGCLAMVVIALLRFDALTVTALIALHLFADWYLGLHLVAITMALALLFAYYFGRNEERPWASLRLPWLWLLFLALTVYPAIHGGKLMLYDLASFYPSNILGALLFFWLGSIVSRDGKALRLVFQLLAAFAALLAFHSIIESVTGTFFFQSAQSTAYLASVSNYQIEGTGAFRVGSFFIDPNWNGTFFATAFFLPFGLFIESLGRNEPGGMGVKGAINLAPTVYLGEMLLILPALLFTYSNGAWVAVLAATFVFLIFIGRARHRVLLLLLMGTMAALGLTLFGAQIAVQLQHAAAPNELSLRLAAWQTALRVIEAFPLFGVGLGYQAYLLRANPYRVPAQFVPLSHPHDSYLEWGAMAGVPVMLVFLALLAAAFYFAVGNWRLADMRTRPLIGGGIAALTALSIGSISINGWTLPPLAAFGWLIAGLIGSPLLQQWLSKRRSATHNNRDLGMEQKPCH